jgi:hypothetical protein
MGFLEAFIEIARKFRGMPQKKVLSKTNAGHDKKRFHVRSATAAT